MDLIQTRRHAFVKRLRDVRDGRDRGSLFVEGPKLVGELLQSPWKISGFAFARPLENHPLVHQLRERGAEGAALAAEVMDFVSDLETPPGLIALAERPVFDMPPLWRNPDPLFLLLDGLQLPNNVGAVLRVAEAAGVRAVFHSRGGADPFSPKALRASAGSLFRLPVLTEKSTSDWIALLADHKVPCVAAAPRGAVPYTEWDWRQPTALLLSSEGKGADESIPLSTLRIPMKPPVESLNVAVAAGILLYEGARQRGLHERNRLS